MPRIGRLTESNLIYLFISILLALSGFFLGRIWGAINPSLPSLEEFRLITTALGPVALSCIALFGIMSWRRQEEQKRKADIALEIYKEMSPPVVEFLHLADRALRLAMLEKSSSLLTKNHNLYKKFEKQVKALELKIKEIPLEPADRATLNILSENFASPIEKIQQGVLYSSLSNEALDKFDALFSCSSSLEYLKSELENYILLKSSRKETSGQD